jgi:stage II sporulation SpoAA-like protein
MVERIEGMPAGTIGMRASGKLSKDDYTGVIEPALREAVDSGAVRAVFVLTDFGGLEHGAWIEDLKTGLGLGIGNRSAWKRFALVTDVEWVEKAMRMFAWMTPGEVKVYDDLDDVGEATRWVAG